MPFTTNGEIRIHYETEGNGPALMFAHGGTSNLQSWRESGYIEAFRNDYTIILYDARGHGQSDKPYTAEAYDYRLMVGDALAVLDALGIDQTHFWGYSMGGVMGCGLAELAPQRIRSLILGGTNPTGHPEPATNPPSEFLQLMRNGKRIGADAVVQGMRELFGDISPGYEVRLRQLDYQAVAAFLEYWQYQLPSLEAVLPTMQMPCLVYITEGDDPDFTETRAWVSQIPHATFVGMSGNHVNGNPEQEIAHAKKFLAQL